MRVRNGLQRIAASLLLAIIITTGLAASPAHADNVRTQLDAGLAGGTDKLLGVLAQHAKPAEQAEVSAWIKEKVETGQAPDSFASAMILVAAESGNKADALMYLDYFRALVIIDSAACADATAGPTLLQGSIFLYGQMVNDKTLTQDQRQAAVDRAIALEAATAAARKPDPAICAAGGRPPEAAKPAARYADDAIWRQKRDEALPKLQETLLKLSGTHESK